MLKVTFMFLLFTVVASFYPDEAASNKVGNDDDYRIPGSEIIG